MKSRKIKFGRYFFEFLSVFVAVISAFALNNWNDNRRDAIAEEKILIEIRNGLQQDLIDVAANRKGHLDGIKRSFYFKKIIENKEVILDSFANKYSQLTGGNFSIMNISGYESLKSRGLEIIKKDSLRSHIISLYEINYQRIKKYEEGTSEVEIYQNFYTPVHEILSEHLIYNDNAQLISIDTSLQLSKREKSDFNSYLYSMIKNRYIKILEYDKLKVKIEDVLANIDEELELTNDD
ncbi:hypothetical protein [uncultured Dokdonia sp.]|uniref:hypothetical protein n=1 Tax=uncultured Dokdonia sp. TaxID=575653 RepID=UPI002618AEED|nr:hypothetical protein [uncultured Dokdonia sp.]